MGGSQSVQKNEDPGEVSTSTGLHVIELHMPTAGLGIGTLIIIGLFICGSCACYRYFARRWTRRRRPANDFTSCPPVHYDARIPAVSWIMNERAMRAPGQSRQLPVAPDERRFTETMDAEAQTPRVDRQSMS